MKKEKTLEQVFDMPKEKEEKKDDDEAVPKPTPKKAPVKRVKALDLEKEKELCEQKLQIIEKLKEARVKRGAAKAAAAEPKEAAAVPPAAAPAPAPAPAPAAAPAAAPASAPAPPMPPPPSAPIAIPPPVKITRCTFKKPIWG